VKTTKRKSFIVISKEIFHVWFSRNLSDKVDKRVKQYHWNVATCVMKLFLEINLELSELSMGHVYKKLSSISFT